jgi:hypothetical protein
MFERNRVQLVAAGLTGNNSTLGNEVVLSGLRNRASFSLGHFHFETDGYRENNDLEHNIYNAFVQASLDRNVDVQIELRQRETEHGDLRHNFDPTDFSLDDRRVETRDSARVGVRITPSPKSDLLVSLIHADIDQIDEQMPISGVTDDIESQSSGHDLQAQFLHRERLANFVVGVGAYEIDLDQVQTIDISGLFPGGICPPFPPFFGVCTSVTPSSKKQTQQNAYVYSNVSWSRDATWTIGVSYDLLDNTPVEVEQFNPKLGLQWNMTESSRLRLAYFKTVKRVLLLNQTLEPTQVAGFNQFFDDFNGSTAERYGVGLDIDFLRSLYGGVELSHRNIDVPTVLTGTSFVRTEHHFEALYRGYAYWAPSPEWAITTELAFERFESDDVAIFGLPTKIDTLSIPVNGRYFNPSGFFAEFRGTYVSQSLDYQTPGLDTDKDNFFLVDIMFGYRIPKRHGIFSIGVQNVFDEEFHYQDQNTQTTDVMNPRYIPAQLVRAQITLAF